MDCRNPHRKNLLKALKYILFGEFQGDFLPAILGFEFDVQIDTAVPDSQCQRGFSFVSLDMRNFDHRGNDLCSIVALSIFFFETRKTFTRIRKSLGSSESSIPGHGILDFCESEY